MVRNIFKNSNTYLTALAMCAAIASCTTNEEISQEDEKTSSELSCTAKEIQSEDELSSRSSLSFNAGSMKFAWTDGDVMTVMAKDDNRARQLYTLQSGIGSPDARFYAENFRLREKQLYFAFSKQENDKVTIPDQNNITVDYSGQTQVGNASAEHLGNYDFMAAGTVCTDENSTHFFFDHLGSTVRVVMAFDPTELAEGSDERVALEATPEHDADKMTRFTEMEIYDSENTFRQTKRNFSFSTGINPDGTYTFKWPEQEINSMDRFVLKFQSTDPAKEGITRYDDFLDGSGKNNSKVIAYIEIPPIDFTNKKIGVMLKGYYEKSGVKHDVSYVGTYDQGWTFSGVRTYEITNNRMYPIKITMKKPEKFDISLKVNHMWQHGSTLDQTKPESKAGTGDPGYDKEIVTPTHIYYIYCHDGKVVKPTSTGSAVTSITITPEQLESAWDTKNTDGVWTSTYKGGTNNGIITLDKPECKKATKDEKCEYHLYAVASTSPLSISVSEGASEEEVVRALKYNLPDANVQTFMRDLYSTPWDATNFVGDITDPVQDVILYHVAAKVDLKWNSATAVERVYADNVKNNNLLLFQPTQNLGGVVTPANGSAFEEDENQGYSDSWAMPVDQQYNGRYILYLPQFKTADNNDCTYNVKLGTYDAENITFTSISTQGGFTSWLRWLKKK